MRLGVEPIQETQVEVLEKFTIHRSSHKEACPALEKAVDYMACFYAIHLQAASAYKIGDKVWLNTQNVSMKKLDHKWLGPYPINKVISCNAYSLELPPSFGHTHPVLCSLLYSFTIVKKPQPKCHSPLPPPSIIQYGVPKYRVERTLNGQVFCRRLEYLVQ